MVYIFSYCGIDIYIVRFMINVNVNVFFMVC